MGRHTSAEYEEFEEWLSEHISDSDFERASAPYIDREGGRVSDSELVNAVEAAFENLQSKEEARLRRQGRPATAARSITAYLDKALRQGRKEIGRTLGNREVAGRQVGEVFSEIFRREGERREARRGRAAEQQATETLARAAGVLEGLQEVNRSEALTEDKFTDFKNSDAVLKKLLQEQDIKASLERLETSGLYREDELSSLQSRAADGIRRQEERLEEERRQAENELVRDFLRDIYATTEPSKLNSAYKRQIEKTFKSIGTRERVLRAYYEKKVEIAPSRIQFQTKPIIERLKAIPEGLSTTTREKVVADNAEQVLLNSDVASVYGKDVAKNLTIDTMVAMGLSHEEAKLLRQKYKEERLVKQEADLARSLTMRQRGRTQVRPEEGEET